MAKTAPQGRPPILSLPYAGEWVDVQHLMADTGGIVQIGSTTRGFRLSVPPLSLPEDMNIIMFLACLDRACVEIQPLTPEPQEVELSKQAELTLLGDFAFPPHPVYLWRFGKRGGWEEQGQVEYQNHEGGPKVYIGHIDRFSRYAWARGDE